MEANRLKLLTNLILATAAEMPADDAIGIPEGHIYAAVMGKFSIDEFTAAVDLGVKVGCLTRHPGPTIKGTEKLRLAFARVTGKAAA